MSWDVSHAFSDRLASNKGIERTALDCMRKSGHRLPLMPKTLVRAESTGGSLELIAVSVLAILLVVALAASRNVSDLRGSACEADEMQPAMRWRAAAWAARWFG